MNVVVVYFLTNATNRHKLNYVTSLFDRSQYTVVAIESETSTTGEMTVNEFERRKYLLCLEEGRKNYPDSPVLILRDDISSQTDPSVLTKIIETVVGFTNWDVCYFFKYQDRCDEWKNKIQLNESETAIVETIGAHGDLALLFSTSGRDILLNERPFVVEQAAESPRPKWWNDFVTHFTSAKRDPTFSDLLTEAASQSLVRATAVVPNIFTYDHEAIEQHRYGKLLLQECAYDPANTSRSNESESLPTTKPTREPTPATSIPSSVSSFPSATAVSSTENTENLQRTTSTAPGNQDTVGAASSPSPAFNTTYAIDTPIVQEIIRNANTNLTPRVNTSASKRSMEPKLDHKNEELTPFIPSSRALTSTAMLSKIGLVIGILVIVIILLYVAYSNRKWIQSKWMRTNTTNTNQQPKAEQGNRSRGNNSAGAPRANRSRSIRETELQPVSGATTVTSNAGGAAATAATISAATSPTSVQGGSAGAVPKTSTTATSSRQATRLKYGKESTSESLPAISAAKRPSPSVDLLRNVELTSTVSKNPRS